MKKTKIVCTIGPATWDEDVMKNIINYGMDCARVNGAFADPLELDKVRSLVRKFSQHVALMVDIKGPEIRLNEFPEPIILKDRKEIVIGNTEEDEIHPANYQDIYKFVKVGQRLVIGDGDVGFEVIRIEEENIICAVTFGTILKPGKALNIPGVEYSKEVLTDKDKLNLEYAIETGWDFVSASFVRNKESAQIIKNFIAERNSSMKVIAKIEDREGVNNIDEILDVVDGIMIARGGLGVELGLEHVPLVQRQLIRKCNEVGKPAITATQMLESMTKNPIPTRAEASDIYTAVELGTDAVMLSGETSAGDYPVEAVKFLSRAVKTAEFDVEPDIIYSRPHASPTSDALTKAAAEMCINLVDQIDAVVVVSATGNTARMLARHSILQKIFVFTKTDLLARTLSITKNIAGAFKFDGADTKDRDFAVNQIKSKIKEVNILKPNYKILLLGKNPVAGEFYFPNVFEIIELD